MLPNYQIAKKNRKNNSWTRKIGEKKPCTSKGVACLTLTRLDKESDISDHLVSIVTHYFEGTNNAQALNISRNDFFVLLSVRAITISGYSVTSSIMASGAGFRCAALHEMFQISFTCNSLSLLW